MSALSLALEIENRQNTYQPGDVIKGNVIATTTKEVKCKSLSVTLEWYTHGRGDQDRGVVEREIVFRGDFRKHDEKVFPFEFVVPSGPYTYYGHYINLDWTISTDADVPWAFDPSDSFDFKVKPGPNVNVEQIIPKLNYVEHVLRTSDGPSPSLVGMLTVVPGAIIGIGIILYSLTTVGFQVNGFLIMGFIVFLSALWQGRPVIRRLLADQKIKDVMIQLPPAMAPGEEFEASISFVPQSDLDILGVSAELIGEESTIVRSGSTSSTYTHELYADNATQTDGKTGLCKAGEKATFHFTHTVPEDAAYSLELGDNELSWILRIHIDIKRWPDWVGNETILVIPQEARDAIKENE
jgi:hypothetical protein